MNRDEFLTELATEVSPDDWWDGELRRIYEGHIFGWNEYQLRRTELINKPSWDDAPEWAEWLVQDGNGDWFWFDQKDEHGYGEMACDGAIPAGHDWRETLERRPQANEPTTSSLTHIQALEAAAETGMCSDGLPCGKAPHYKNEIGEKYCIGCPNEPTPEEEEAFEAMASKSDGSTASYYELPECAAELQDLISYRNMNSQDGEMFRALYRKGLASHSDELRDAKKVLFYAKAEVDRLERYGR